MPYKNEYSCRLENPDKYDKIRRKNCAQKHDGKCIDVIYGIKNNKSEIQALRYKKKVWDIDDARRHCKSRNGNFHKEAKMPEMIYKEFEAKTKFIEDKDYFLATVSTGDVDRDGDILEPEGADFKDYNKTILYRHNRTPGATAEETLPVGHSLWEKIDGNEIKMAIEFNRKTKLSDLLYAFYKSGDMSDWSIGFTPHDIEPIKNDKGEITGRHINRFSIHEVSSVPVGANQNTETQVRMKELCREKGLSEDFVLELFEGREEIDIEAKSDEPYDENIDSTIAALQIATTNFAGSPRNPYGTHSSYKFKGGKKGYKAAWKCHFSKIGRGGTSGKATGPIRGTVRRCAMLATRLKGSCNLPSTDNIGARKGPDSPLKCSFPTGPSDYGLDSWKEAESDAEKEGKKLSCSDLKVIKRAALAEIKKRQQMEEDEYILQDLKDDIHEVKREVIIVKAQLEKLTKQKEETDISYDEYLELSDSGDLDEANQELEIVDESDEECLFIEED